MVCISPIKNPGCAYGMRVTFYCRSNQIFHYTCCITLKRVTSLRGPFPRHCARKTQLFLKKRRCGGEPLATLCPICLARDLNLRPPAPETNALPLDQLASTIYCSLYEYCKPHHQVKQMRTELWCRLSNKYILKSFKLKA